MLFLFRQSQKIIGRHVKKLGKFFEIFARNIGLAVFPSQNRHIADANAFAKCHCGQSAFGTELFKSFRKFTHKFILQHIVCKCIDTNFML